MKNIERISKINKLKLSGEKYFETLVEQACLCGILSDEDAEKIQLGCLSLLAKQTERYNSGDSSSIRVETAQDLLTSIIYTIGICLKTYASPEDAVEALKQKPIEVLFADGKKEIEKMKDTAKLLHARIADNLLKTPNVFYRSTIIDGINGFFKLYYPEFGAHKIHITADYPTFNGVFDLTGIEFIKKYLDNIYFENLFCKNFSEENIHHLLCGVNENYKELLFNIYEPILTEVLGCVILKKDLYCLDLSVSDVYKLRRIFKNKTTAEIQNILVQALGEIKQSLSIQDSLFRYLEGSISKIAMSIKNAEETQTMDKVFVVPAFPENNPVIEFSYGEKMDDKLYRKVIEEITQCQSVQSKLQIIKESVHSLADLEDILLDAELSDEEIKEILKTLTPAEFTALLKKYPYYSNLEMYDSKDNEKQLCLCLNTFLRSLPVNQQNMIEKAVKLFKDDNGIF